MPTQYAIRPGLLLLMIMGLIWSSSTPAQIVGSPPTQPFAPPLAGVNSVTELTVKQTKLNFWTAEFDYFYTGDPANALAVAVVEAPAQHARFFSTAQMLQRGAHHTSIELSYPLSHPLGDQKRTESVSALLITDPLGRRAIVASAAIDAAINWPDYQTWIRDVQIAKSSTEDNLKHAISLIDANDAPELTEAKSLLERLVSENPRLDAGYVELARVAMRSNWSPEGLHQAESLLLSALQINPESANAKILLG
jgi:hypothetical protein